MPRETDIEYIGKVVDLLPNTLFHVIVEGNNTILCHTSGRIRQNRIRIAMGDTVTVVMTPYDLTKGRITYRHK
jgi:translation initiation factor IF-1